MHYSSSILLSLILLQSILCSKEELEKNRTILYISDGTFQINETNVTFLNNKNQKTPLSSSGKVYHFKAVQDFKDIFNITKMTQFFVLLIDNSDLLKLLVSNPLAPLTIQGIIIPNNTNFNNTIINSFIHQLQYNIFMSNTTDLSYFIQYNILTEDSNYFFHFSYKATIFITPFVYLKTLSVVSFVLSFLIVILWAIKQKFTPPENIILIQKIFIFLPYLNIILSALLIVQMFLTTGSSTNSFLDSRIYVETALVTIRAIFRTIIWFLVILIASGWQITSNSLSRDKIKTFIKVYVFIYIVVCVDQIVDAFVGSIFIIFYPSEIKNIFFYLLMAIGISFEGRKTMKMLKNKLIYAISLSPQYIPSLVLKKKLMIYHISFAIGYFFVYSTLLTVHKVVLSVYNIQDFLLVNYHFIDIVFLSLYLILYRPRKLPPHFNVDFGDEEIIDYGRIFTAKIPNVLEVFDARKGTMLSRAEIEQVSRDSQNENEKSPLIIIHPGTLTKEDEDKKTVNIVIDKVSIGYFITRE